ncbi:chemotaxis protein CheA [Seleniivibrio woodruffii]|uniref:chemotaxis protein CheA n=1 Tax=Seleniivibrio woodruffii TaxID=1078050 RepID=UPI0026ECA798|nr:chemotaxis protein CheA [Seleniivibrio woodruffii]
MSADVHQEVFIQEATELLQELEESLLELDDNREDMELVARVFRAMHTIKGSGAMFGFENIAALVHSIETSYDLVRNGKLGITKPMLDYSLKACDIIKEMLTDPAMKADSPLALEISAFFTETGGQAPAKKVHEPVSKEALLVRQNLTTFRITFKPSPEILLYGSNPELLVKEVAALGEASVSALTTHMPDLNSIEPEKCYTYWEIILTTDKSENDVRDVFIFVQDESEININIIDDFTGGGDNLKRIGEILLEKGDINNEDLTALMDERKLIGEVMVEKGLVSQDALDAALTEQQHVRQIREQKAAAENISSVRVPSEKLDFLVDLVGELVTVQARLSQIAVKENNQEMLKVAEEVERLVWELRDNTMSIRMLEIGSTFSKFKRLVRDLSAELGKEIELVTHGGETEIDKTVIEKLGDPLVHLIRNSIDHGIETPQERIAAGKEEKGHIILSANHSGDSVLIEISDDGKGIDKAAVLKKAKAKGLVSEGTELSDKDVFDLIFAPGFSTAEKVSSVSGRGVGMDVVRRNIEALRGTIDIASVQGKGTNITLKLPLTLAIIDGLLVVIDDQFFIIPLSIVNECIEFNEAAHRSSSGRRIIMVRNELIPYIHLRSFFNIQSEAPEIQQIVIIELDGRRVGFVVDSVVGDHQTVIKSLGKAFKDIECISGASVLGDGSVALIVDVQKIYTGIE